MVQTNELEAVQHVHAQHYLALAEEAEPHLAGREERAWLKRLGREQDNLRAALRWGFELREAEFSLRLAGALWQFWSLRGQWSEGRRWLEEALSLASKAEVNGAPRAKALYAAAILMRYQYDFSRARALCEQSITLYRALGDKEGLLAALHQLCRIMDYLGNVEPVRARLPEILALTEALPDVTVKAQVFAELPAIAHGSLSSGVMARYLAESERIYRALDDPAGLASTLFMQGGVAESQGDSARARALREEAERIAADVDDQRLRLKLLSGRIVSAWQSGDSASARRYLEQALTASLEFDESSGQTRLILPGQRNVFLGILASVLHQQGLAVWAARVYGLAGKLAQTSESPRMGSELFDPIRKRVAVVREEVHAQLGEEAFARAFAEGQAMSEEDLLTIPQPKPQSHAQHQPTPSASSSQVPPEIPYEPLSARELEVLHLLTKDLNNPQIAERLVVSRRTVDAHLRSIYAKLGVRSHDAATRVAREFGLV